MHVGTISMELSILYFKVLLVIISTSEQSSGTFNFIV